MGGEIRTSLKLEPRYENAGDVMSKIVEIDSDPQTVRAGIHAAGIGSFGSLESLVNAYGTIFAYLEENYKDLAALKKYWAYLSENVVFWNRTQFFSISTDLLYLINPDLVDCESISMDPCSTVIFCEV